MPSLSVRPNDRVTFAVLHEDDDVAVVVKPPHVVTEPGLGHEDDTLLNGMFARWGARLQNLGARRDFGLLHRLDRRASGVLIVGLRADAYDALRARFESREVRKYYWALVRGEPKEPSGVIRLPILEPAGRDAGDAPAARSSARMSRVSRSGKPAVTAYRVLQSGRHASLLECRAVTGRMHQLRVHLAAIGCPILGDDLYAPPDVRDAAARLALHAWRAVFPHPRTGETCDARSAWPSDLRAALKHHGLTRPDAGRVGLRTVDRLGEGEDDAVRDEHPGVGQPPGGA